VRGTSGSVVEVLGDDLRLGRRRGVLWGVLWLTRYECERPQRPPGLRLRPLSPYLGVGHPGGRGYRWRVLSRCRKAWVSRDGEEEGGLGENDWGVG
jgi:hypothetical protein